MLRRSRNVFAAARRFADRARWSGDLRTLRHFYRSTDGLQRLRVRFAGGTHPFWVRGGTLDAEIAAQIIRDDSEYRLPIDADPQVIFDVGANIGAASVYFALRYPRARVFAFEPLPENLDVLHRNLEPFGDRVTIVPMGLGDRPGTFTYHYSADSGNLGGGTFHGVGCDLRRSVRLPVTTIAEICRSTSVDRINVMKIDTEGAELSVLRGTPSWLLSRIDFLIGELHSVDDWTLCQTLDRTHRLGLTKRLDRDCYPFVAVRRPQPVAAYRLADAA